MARLALVLLARRMNQARNRIRVVDPVDHLPITKQIWEGIVRNIGRKDLALANLLLLTHKQIENVLRNLRCRMHILT